ncbi:MAG TPA: FAD-dependent oxidoreductase [Anaerolineae bacterium]|nr:FAD-dependent oxidoreductase [Anaerolineae bacterium]
MHTETEDGAVLAPSASVDVLIVGAGLSGLLAAHELQAHGLTALLLDKGCSVGGRLATRRVGPGRADHGAQFFTVRSPEFRAWVERWQAEGLVFVWSTGWSDGSLADAPSDGHPRYAVRGGMNALAQHLAQGLDVRVDRPVTSVTPTANGWQVTDQSGQVYTGRGLLLTPPVPQSLALLDASGVALADRDREDLERIEYAPSLAGIFWLDRPARLPEPGAMQRSNAPIAWMADNQRKGISPEATLATVHAAPEISQAAWQTPEPAVLESLYEGLRPFLEPGTQVVESQLKRWRYAVPVEFHPERTLLAEGLPALAFAGDAFGGPRIEGAALSGLAAGQALSAGL